MSDVNILLTRLKPEDVKQEYVDWLNDVETNKFLESRHIKHDLKSVRLFVEDMIKDDCNFLFGIFCKKTNKHVGNIKLGPINYRYKTAEVGLIIGNKDYWGLGFATQAIKDVCLFAQKVLGVNKVEAGCYASNLASKKIFLKCGFEIEGVLKEHFSINDKPEDCIRLGRVLSNGNEA